MTLLKIQIEEGRSAFAPGEEIAGRIEWRFDEPATWVELRLFWYTRGKGTQDDEVVDSVRIDDPGATGDQEFRFQLPQGPLSFSGKLISLIWALELVSKPKATERAEIVLSHTGEEIDLS